MKIDPRKFWPEVLPGWKMNIQEVSYGYYEVLISDDYGRQTSASGTHPEMLITIAEQYVLDIEKQISKNFNKFLFELFKLKLNKKNITDQRYDDTVFGSWCIEVADKRLMFNDKDYELLFQSKRGEVWKDGNAIKRDVLTMRDINELVMLL